MTSLFDDVGEAGDEHFTGEVDLNLSRVDLFPSDEIDRFLGDARIAEVDQTLRRLTLLLISVVDVDIEHLLGGETGDPHDRDAQDGLRGVQGEIVQPEHVGRLTLAEAQLEKRGNEVRSKNVERLL